jgi:hypothetical protein
MVTIIIITVKELGAELVDVRLSAGLTQEELDRCGGVFQKWNWYGGDRGCPSAGMDKVLAALRALVMRAQNAPQNNVLSSQSVRNI